MCTITISDKELAEQVNLLLTSSFDNNSELMMRELIALYKSRLERISYSGSVKWEKDGLEYQKDIRGDWQ